MYSSKPYTYKVKDNYYHEIVVRPRLEGYVNNNKNLILYNYYALLFGELADTNVSAISTGGSNFTLGTSGDVSTGTIGIVYGTGTSPEVFGNYVLTSMTSRALSTSSVQCDSEKCVLNFVHTPTSSYSEIGLLQFLSNIDFLLTRKVMSIQANRQVIYRLIYGYPWTSNLAWLMYGTHMNANYNVVRVDGQSFTSRSSGDWNNGSMYIVASASQVQYSPSLTSIPNAFTISTSNSLSSSLGSWIHLISQGTITPQSDTTVNTLGLYMNVFDSSGSSHTTCLAVIPLSQPITLRGGRTNFIIVRFVAM